MAKIVIAGDAVVITSAIKMDDIKLVQKYRPEALLLKDEDGEAFFRVGTTPTSSGTVGKYGVEFGGTSHDGQGFATVTLVGSGESDNIRDAVLEQIGTAILNLNKVEEKLPAAIAEIAAEKEAILATITVV